MKRDAAQTIFRTVVFAGAMLGAGCGGKKSATTTPPAPPDPAMTDPAMTDPATDPATDPVATPDPCAGNDPCANADPCGERPRGGDDEDPCGGGMGRGFILS